MDSANKRIAVNTIYMYAQLFITMAIGLYSSRIVLDVLGVSDFGLYSIVGGVLALFSFITTSLGDATTRAMNTEMGKPNGDLNITFNINLTLHVALALLILILAETIGLWYINNKLNIEEGKLGDAIFVYQISIITCCLGIINTPYMGVFSSHEKFGFLAKFDIINNMLRLGCIVAMQYYSGNHLRLYCLIMSLTTINTFVVYHYFASKWWPNIVRFSFHFDKQKYKETLSFGGWTVLSSAAAMARNSGSDLIVNSFFGTGVNGVFAVGKTINSYVMVLSGKFDGASGPQIIQSYSAGDYNRCYYLVNKIGRYCLLLYIFLCFPLLIELDLILHVWLKEVPDGVLLLTQLNLILGGVALTSGGIVQLINASGKLKWFKLAYCILMISCVPVGIYMFQMGMPYYSLMILFVVADVLYRVIQLVLLKVVLNFKVVDYMRQAYIRPLVISVLMIMLLYLHSLLNIETTGLKIISILLCGLVDGSLILLIGLSSRERKKLVGFIKNKRISTI